VADDPDQRLSGPPKLALVSEAHDAAARRLAVAGGRIATGPGPIRRSHRDLRLARNGPRNGAVFLALLERARAGCQRAPAVIVVEAAAPQGPAGGLAALNGRSWLRRASQAQARTPGRSVALLNSGRLSAVSQP